MNGRRLLQFVRLALFISLLVALTGGYSALAQSSSLNVRVTAVRSKSISISWDHAEANAYYFITYKRVGSNSLESSSAGQTAGNSFTLRGLMRNATYRIEVDGGNFVGSVTASTLRSAPAPVRYTPPPVTCPFLPDHITVTGYPSATQCQTVDEAGIGQMAVINRGVIDAVDIWNFTPSLVEVCIRGDGWLVLLNAAYSPRRVMELAHFHRDGKTCGIIDRAGTVALLTRGPAAAVTPEPAQPQTQIQPEQPTLPTFEPIPLADCQIKLVETLYLRAEPAGEIIGIVWLNSEVPAFEINGYWYKIEFEGVTGYVSRYYREVLRGGCG